MSLECIFPKVVQKASSPWEGTTCNEEQQYNTCNKFVDTQILPRLRRQLQNTKTQSIGKMYSRYSVCHCRQITNPQNRLSNDLFSKGTDLFLKIEEQSTRWKMMLLKITGSIGLDLFCPWGK
jgi:hypothetical protein